jgi:hypothetical protein
MVYNTQINGFLDLSIVSNSLDLSIVSNFKQPENRVSENGYESLRFELFTAVAIKNVVFWDIKTQFVLHRRHITSPLERSAG